ncbi:MAG TPA: glycosyltransferase [Angustibacter sp.]|nr:glycosyltransferase [Angustibacter sp.]
MARGTADVSVVSTGHDVADARLHREVAAWRRAGLTVDVRGLGDAADAPAGAAVRTHGRRGMVVRLARALVWPWAASGRVVVLLDPDTVPSALVATRLRHRALVCDVHEDYERLLADRSWVPRPLARALRRLTRWAVGLAGRSDVTVVADEQVPPQADRCRTRTVVRNLPDLTMVPARSAGAADDVPLRAVYVGDLRRSRGGRECVEAVAAAPGWQLDLVGPAPAEEAAWLSQRLEQPDVAGRVRWHGRQPPQQAWTIARGAHVGLVLLHDTPAFREAMPTKVYEYLACGLGVVSTSLPRVEQLVTDLGVGWVVSHPVDAQQVLSRLAQHRPELDEALSAAARWSTDQAEQASEYDALAERVATLAQRA